MSRVGVSIGRGFDDYGALHSTLSSLQITEVITLPNEHVKRFGQETGVSVQEVQIDWNDIRGAQNVKPNKWGKMYNADAPADAAKKIVEMSDQIIEFAGGDYNIRKFGKDKVVGENRSNPTIEKRYKF